MSIEKVENPVNLNDKVKVTVTKDGAEVAHNDWKEGDVVEMHPHTAKYLEKRKLVTTSTKIK